MAKTSINAFTTYSQSLLNSLRNQVGIAASGNKNMKVFKAIWDTGATNSVITQRVVRECGLQSSGLTKMNAVNNSSTSHTYLVNIFLPNKVEVLDIRVSEASLAGDEDVLIGMDIINLGDLAISSWQGRTSFTFRVPSQGRIDFLPPKNRPNLDQARSQKRTGRNEPCPCGSGKKYKNCCIKAQAPKSASQTDRDMRNV